MNTERLKMLREKRGLTQTEFAAVFGFSNQRYNYYETGKREPDNETLLKFANYLYVSIDYLLGNTDDPTPPDAKKDPLDGLKFALWGHGDISDAALDDVRRYAQFIEQREKEQENGKLK